MTKLLRLLPLAAGLLAAPALAEEAPICTDRPTKANAVCTVPAGKFQIEATAVSWSQTEASGTHSNTWTIGAPVLKYGLSDRSDLQLSLVPFVDVKTRQDGPDSQASGIGDVTVRYKHRLTGEASKVQAAVIPFVKLPTAKSGIGNGKVEGGLAVPLSLPVSSITLTFGPELDLLADADGNGSHLALVNLINLSGAIAPNLTLIGELWMSNNFDPAGNFTQASADAALAYLVKNNLQLDLGANFGLTRSTADVELYAGISVRF